MVTGTAIELAAVVAVAVATVAVAVAVAVVAVVAVATVAVAAVAVAVAVAVAIAAVATEQQGLSMAHLLKVSRFMACFGSRQVRHRVLSCKTCCPSVLVAQIAHFVFRCCCCCCCSSSR